MYKFRCSKCGTLNVGNQEFCLICKTPRTDTRDASPNGTLQPIQAYVDEQMNAMVCKKCGVPLNPNAKFCTKCGASVMTPEQTSYTSAVKNCPECQAEIPPKAHFCTKCGCAVDQELTDKYQSMASNRCPACILRQKQINKYNFMLRIDRYPHMESLY
jgi:ribosomal protein L40E